MSDELPVSRWITAAKEGQPEAADRLWKHYFPRLVRLARRKLEGVPRRMADKEDVALSAFKSFCRAAEQGRFPDLEDRDGLWRLLFDMTARKADDLRRYSRRKIRDERRNTGEGELAGGMAGFAGGEPAPDLAALLAEECQRRLAQLRPEQQAVALARLEGYSNEEIAVQHSCALRTVERQLERIRKTWARKEPAGSPSDPPASDAATNGADTA